MQNFNQIWLTIRWEMDHLNFHKTGFLIIWRHKFLFPDPYQNPSDLVYLNLYSSGMRRDIEKQ